MSSDCEVDGLTLGQDDVDDRIPAPAASIRHTVSAAGAAPGAPQLDLVCAVNRRGEALDAPVGAIATVIGEFCRHIHRIQIHIRPRHLEAAAGLIIHQPGLAVRAPAGELIIRLLKSRVPYGDALSGSMGLRCRRTPGAAVCVVCYRIGDRRPDRIEVRVPVICEDIIRRVGRRFGCAGLIPAEEAVILTYRDIRDNGRCYAMLFGRRFQDCAVRKLCVLPRRRIHMESKGIARRRLRVPRGIQNDGLVLRIERPREVVQVLVVCPLLAYRPAEKSPGAPDRDLS